MKYPYRRHNPKVIALIIEIVLLAGFELTALILDSAGKPMNWILLLVVTLVLIFILILTLSLIRYDSMRAIRETFKDTNMPLYTDQTTLMGHDIKDEEEKDR